MRSTRLLPYCGCDLSEIVQERDAILARLTDYFRQKPGTLGLFLTGSVAGGTADAWSDLDVSVVVDDRHFEHFCSQRHAAPASWGRLLFNTGSMGSHMCVSHFAPLVKVDVFYYRPADLKPSAWIACGVRSLLDESGAVQRLIEQSKGMTFHAESRVVNHAIDSALASVHEVVRRAWRGELAYAQSLLNEVRWHIAILQDYALSRPPKGLSHFEMSCDNPEVLQAICASHPQHNARGILAALSLLLPVLHKQMETLERQLNLGRSIERDNAALSIVQQFCDQAS